MRVSRNSPCVCCVSDRWVASDGRAVHFAPIALVRKSVRNDTVHLSPREQEVLRGICAGKSNKEIARDHALQEVTVKLHVKTMSRKLGARNRTHAAMIARDRRLV